jgi:Tat protein translocase TatB subunit
MNIGGIGPLELMIVMVLALVVIGPERLPGVARRMGQLLAQFRQMSEELTRELAVQLDEETKALEEPPQTTPIIEAQSEHSAPNTEIAAASSSADIPAEEEVEPPVLPPAFEPVAHRRSHRWPSWSESDTGLSKLVQEINQDRPSTAAASNNTRSHRRPVFSPQILPATPAQAITLETEMAKLPTVKARRPRRKALEATSDLAREPEAGIEAPSQPLENSEAVA